MWRLRPFPASEVKEKMSDYPTYPVPANPYGDDVESVLIPEEELHARITEMADRLSAELAAGREGIEPGSAEDPGDPILVCVLKGAVFFITDFARAMSVPTQLEFMAVSSYGNSTSSSGIVRILKDLDRDIRGRDVVIVEDIVDSGLTLHWLVHNLKNRGPRSLRIVTLLRKPDAVKVDIDLFDIGFDLPNKFVVGYGLDYAERYRDLPWVGLLRQSVYE